MVGLQEVHRFQQRSLLRAVPGFDALGRGRSRWGCGERCPVLVRRSRLDVLSWGTRWYGEDEQRPGTRLPGAGFPRIATWARLRDRATGVELDVCNTHLDEHRADNRLRSAEQLATWVSPERPTVVLGDFNASEGDPLFDVLRAAGLATVLPPDAGGTFHRFTGRVDGPRIDHVLVSPHWEVRAARVVADARARTLPSDHWPVVVRLRLYSVG